MVLLTWTSLFILWGISRPEKLQPRLSLTWFSIPIMTAQCRKMGTPYSHLICCWEEARLGRVCQACASTVSWPRDGVWEYPEHPSASLLLMPGESQRLWQGCLNLAINRAEGLAIPASFTLLQTLHHCKCCSYFTLEMLTVILGQSVSVEQNRRVRCDLLEHHQSLRSTNST